MYLLYDSHTMNLYDISYAVSPPEVAKPTAWRSLEVDKAEGVAEASFLTRPDVYMTYYSILWYSIVYNT